jgi:hypothetical protein
MKHERETLEAVIAARNQASSASSGAGRSDRPRGDAQLAGAERGARRRADALLRALRGVPGPQGRREHAQLTEELASTENRIAFARQSYNDAVTLQHRARDLPVEHHRRDVRLQEARCSSSRTRRSARRRASPSDAPRGASRARAPPVAMDFFEAQDSARSRSRTLVLLFVAAVLAIIATDLRGGAPGDRPGALAGPIDLLLLLGRGVGTTLVVDGGQHLRARCSCGRADREGRGDARRPAWCAPNTTDEAERASSTWSRRWRSPPARRCHACT